VGRAQGLPRRRPRARGRGRAGGRQLPALREGLRRRGVGGARLKRAAAPAVALAAAALAACGGAAREPARAAAPLSGHVVAITDGDTIRVRLASGRLERVRYIGVDTPELPHFGAPVECYAKRATAFNARLVAGRDVRLVRDVEARDRYGRLLAYVYAGRTFVNAKLVRRGYATVLTVPPNVRFATTFTRLAHRARRAGLGLWASCGS
jgi:micrococcal nuclease